MTVVNAATDPAAAALPDGTPPAVEPPAAVTPAPAGEEMVSVPRSSLTDYDGSWHKVAEAANKHRALGPMGDFAQELAEAGYSPAQVREVLIQAQRAGSLGEPTPPPPEQGLTREEFQQGLQDMKQSFGQTLSEQKAANEQLDQRKATIRERQDAEVAFRTKTLKDMEFVTDNEDGTPNRAGRIVMREFNQELGAIMQEQEPQGLDKDGRELYYASPTNEQLDAAAGKVADLKGLKYEMAADVAREQEQTPTASLGTGTAAVATPPKFEDLSPEDRVAAITQGSEIERPDDSPDKDFSDNE